MTNQHLDVKTKEKTMFPLIIDAEWYVTPCCISVGGYGSGTDVAEDCVEN